MLNQIMINDYTLIVNRELDTNEQKYLFINII